MKIRVLKYSNICVNIYGDISQYLYYNSRILFSKGEYTMDVLLQYMYCEVRPVVSDGGSSSFLN